MSVLTQAGMIVLVYMTAWFLVALALKRNDVADVAWGLGFVVIAWWGWLLGAAENTARLGLVTGLVTVWGVRLAFHIGRRNFSPTHREDPRYAAWRLEWGRWFVPRSYLQVFLLQGALMLVVSAPVLVVIARPGPPLGVIDLVGALLWLAGITSETLADAQLARHLSHAENRGAPLDRGLWAWSRHPNYVGEALAWWGLGVIALSAPDGWVGLIGPLAITLLLRYVSGVPMLERRHQGDPAWDAYRVRVPIFWPRPPQARG
jgi:steroid 5-alpha reductase family enzyme